MIGALVVGRPHAPEVAARPRLYKAIAATKKRQQTRPAVDWDAFDQDRLEASLDAKERKAFAFVLAQMQAFEAAAPRSLRVLANATPIAAVQESYHAQIDDEIVHTAMFQKYREAICASAIGQHPVTRISPHAAAFIQHDPVVGAVGVTTGIEFFAVEVLRALKARVDEPLFRALIDHIEVDERRHQVLAVEAVAALGQAQLIRPGVARARIRAGRRVVEAFFRHATCRAYAEPAHVLGVDVRGLYEKSLDTISDHFRRELPPEVAQSL